MKRWTQMQSMAWAMFGLAAIGWQAASAASQMDFSSYEIILTRKPFGEPPPEAAAATAAATAATSFIKDIRMCAITQTPEFGVRVGFVDLAAKKPYYMPVGSTEDGIQVVDADYEKEAALLQKGNDAFWINMTGQVNPGNAGPIASAPAAAATSTSDSSPAAAALATIVTSGPGRMSYSERVKIRRAAIEEKRKQDAERLKKLVGEEYEKKLKEYQMDLIRAGDKGPPLPMPLTKEMDDQLVNEGVLPPLDESGAAVATPEGTTTETVSPPAPVTQ